MYNECDSTSQIEVTNKTVYIEEVKNITNKSKNHIIIVSSFYDVNFKISCHVMYNHVNSTNYA